ncbi:MAG TPA: hypothetical protein PLA05_03460 [bacterium]|jgi:uncharacterized membrane protein|nr:MAG: hypothetical protein BWX82_00109 [Parcubacteria group bacterium ADurb.Bin115]HPW05986.1 hypothetical protein [bacterium]HQM18912.1 hypothetical protein [Candidatus Paceibacterota bacterium]HPY99784.1 hypothetical protein [bacterium]HQB76468.1 hypothetical protein [bacterium]
MNYNLHPIFVHFPIALFLLYSFLRIFPWPKRFPNVDWRLPRVVILVTGLLGAWLSSVTGEIANHIVRPSRSLLEMHEGFAGASVSVYVVLLIAELFIFFQPTWLDNKYLSFLKSLNPVFLFLKKLFSQNWIMWLLSGAGALLIAITGLLGGVMVYGTTADPLAAPILNLLGL